MRRYILTGAPGAGKTTILAELQARGLPVVAEAATDVIDRELASGRAMPPGDHNFLNAIVALQRERQHQPPPPGAEVQIFDRSPICTLALAHYSGQPVTPLLAAEVDRIVTARFYQRQVFFVALLGFITPTPARRISLENSIRFEKFHEQAYRGYGFEPITIPIATVSNAPT